MPVRHVILQALRWSACKTILEISIDSSVSPGTMVTAEANNLEKYSFPHRLVGTVRISYVEAAESKTTTMSHSGCDLNRTGRFSGRRNARNLACSCL